MSNFLGHPVLFFYLLKLIFCDPYLEVFHAVFFVGNHAGLVFQNAIEQALFFVSEWLFRAVKRPFFSLSWNFWTKLLLLQELWEKTDFLGRVCRQIPSVFPKNILVHLIKQSSIYPGNTVISPCQAD